MKQPGKHVTTHPPRAVPRARNSALVPNDCPVIPSWILLMHSGRQAISPAAARMGVRLSLRRQGRNFIDSVSKLSLLHFAAVANCLRGLWRTLQQQPFGSKRWCKPKTLKLRCRMKGVRWQRDTSSIFSECTVFLSGVQTSGALFELLV